MADLPPLLPPDLSDVPPPRGTKRKDTADDVDDGGPVVTTGPDELTMSIVSHSDPLDHHQYAPVDPHEDPHAYAHDPHAHHQMGHHHHHHDPHVHQNLPHHHHPHQNIHPDDVDDPHHLREPHVEDDDDGLKDAAAEAAHQLQVVQAAQEHAARLAQEAATAAAVAAAVEEQRRREEEEAAASAVVGMQPGDMLRQMDAMVVQRMPVRVGRPAKKQRLNKDGTPVTYGCELCGKVFTLKSNQQRHIKVVHQGLKGHKCRECDYECSQKADLTKHYNTVHLKKKDFACSEPGCDYKCGQKSHLTAHLHIKHQKNRFKCMVCEYSCGSARYLQQHVRVVHHNMKDYECPECNYRCGHKSNLTRHIKMMHPQEAPNNGAALTAAVLQQSGVQKKDGPQPTVAV